MIISALYYIFTAAGLHTAPTAGFVPDEEETALFFATYTHTQTQIAIESGIETSTKVVRSQTSRCRTGPARFLLHCSRPVGTVVTNRAASHQKED